jgi:hypothetical protein
MKIDFKKLSGKVKASWEYASLKFLLKLFTIYLPFIFYVMIGGTLTATWFRIKWVQNQSLAELPYVAQRSIHYDTLGDLLFWVQYRPLAETAAIIETLTPYNSELSPAMFLEYARRLRAEKKTEETIDRVLFWTQLHRYRLRYDIVRCNTPRSTEIAGRVLDFFAADDTEKYLTAHPEKIKTSVQEVLKFDAQYPARNTPTETCTPFYKAEKIKNGLPLPREYWVDVRYALRLVTEKSLQKMPDAATKQ